MAKRTTSRQARVGDTVVRGRCGPNCSAANFVTMVGYALACGAGNWTKKLARPTNWRDQRTARSTGDTAPGRDQRRSLHGRTSAAHACHVEGQQRVDMRRSRLLKTDNGGRRFTLVRKRKEPLPCPDSWS